MLKHFKPPANIPFTAVPPPHGVFDDMGVFDFLGPRLAFDTGRSPHLPRRPWRLHPGVGALFGAGVAVLF